MWIETPGTRSRNSSSMGRRKVDNKSSNRRTSRGGTRSANGERPTRFAKPKPSSKKRKSRRLTVPSVAPWKMILGSLLIGLCGLLYITHLLSTQQLLEEVQTLQHEYNRTHRIYSETKLAYDRMTGPKEIYQRARDAGFVNAGPTDEILNLNP
ncbi:MAG: hypothetical protein ACQER4_08485 [Bacteroidota bacterium]